MKYRQNALPHFKQNALAPSGARANLMNLLLHRCVDQEKRPLKNAPIDAKKPRIAAQIFSKKLSSG